MSDLEAWLIIILVIGVIASNLAVLKYSAKYKMPQFGKENKPKRSKPASSTDNKDSRSDKASSKQADNSADKTPTQGDGDKKP